jgi:hypothetical protein
MSKKIRTLLGKVGDKKQLIQEQKEAGGLIIGK